MTDHTGVVVTDLKKSKKFYSVALGAGGRDNGAPACARTITRNYSTTSKPSAASRRELLRATSDTLAL